MLSVAVHVMYVVSIGNASVTTVVSPFSMLIDIGALSERLTVKLYAQLSNTLGTVSLTSALQPSPTSTVVSLEHARTGATVSITVTF